MFNEQKKEKTTFKRPLLNKIVNVFIALTAGILFLLILFFGFSQTNTFRNFLKVQITEAVSESINGDLYIESIEGSILTSVVLNNTRLMSENDTLFIAQKFIIKTSPIHLLLKRILVRDIIINNAYINLYEDSEGKWNLSKLKKKDSEEQIQTAEVDSNRTEFPFTIQVNNISVSNLNFVKQNYSNAKSQKYYKHLNIDDLRLNNIFLNAKVFANLSTSTIRLFLMNFSADPNFESFNLKNLSGEFELNTNHALANNLVLETDSSNIRLSAKIDDLNLLGDVELREFKDYPLTLSLEAYPLNFSDLYTFIDATDFLNGKVNLDMKANGYFGDFDVKKLDMNFMSSFLSLKGKVQNLHTPENLFLDVFINDSKIVESEAHTLVKGLDIPLYPNVILDNLNLNFKGEPTRFHSQLTGDINDANVFVDLYMDLQTEQMEYDLTFTTNSLNIYPVLGLESSISSNGNIKGYGTDPNLMNAKFDFTAFDSMIDSLIIDSVYFTSEIQSKLLDFDLNSIVNKAKTIVLGKLSLENENETEYDLLAFINNLQLNEFTGMESDSSNLNFSFKAKGKNLEIDDLIGEYEISLEPSYLRNLELDETKLSLSLIKNNEDRNINLKSDFVDFNIDGQFSLQKAIDILIYEGITISEIISNKIDELNPINNSDTLNIDLAESVVPEIVKEDLEFNYNFLFKDFELIASFLKNDELDIVGSGEGYVKNDSLNFEISTDITINNLLNKRMNDILYLSNIEANLNFNRDNREVSFNKMFGTISVEGEKIYLGTEINNIAADFVFNQSKLFFNTSFDLGDEFSTDLEGIASAGTFSEIIYLNNIVVNYKNIPWVNYDTSTVLFNSDGIQLSNLILENGSAVLNIDGQINNDESHNFFASIRSMPGALLSNYILDDQTHPLGGHLDLNFVSNGQLTNPKIKMDFNVNNISYNESNFGSLFCMIKHTNSNTLIDIDFVDPFYSLSGPLLTLDAMLPLNINYLDNKNYLTNESDIQISLKSNNFDLASLGNILPYVINQSGKINSRININGRLDDLQSDGFFLLSNGRFTSRQNNLDYDVGIKTILKDQEASIDSFLLSNSGGSQYSGKIKSTGIIGLNKLPFSTIDLKLNGDLALLGKRSNTRKSPIYGDLFIKSDNDWSFKFEDDVYSFDGNIIVERANLVYTSQTEKGLGQNGRIIYRIIEDSTKMSFSNQKFVKILKEVEEKSVSLSKEEETKFNINTNIIINNIASFNFIIAPDLSQKLSVETTGKLEFKSVGNELRTQGSLNLLSGSRLEFFKTFEADGTIRFENDLTDPNFDIVATYAGQVENFENSGRTEDVAVKLKLNSAYSNLRENLSGKNQNLYVYTGASQIENDVPDPKYDQSNALTFVIFDQLSLDLNDEQKSTLGSMTENAAFSLLGSQLTNYLNSTLGGLISNIKLNKNSSRDSYNLLFSGKYNNIRYQFGGSFGSQTDYLQLSKSDIKVEYLFNPNFLIRLEQKSPIIETTAEDKVQELALKYKFTF